MSMDRLKAYLANYKPQLLDEQEYLKAAVLVPLLTKEGEDHILFQVRSQKLRRQPGDISFPGGVVEAEDQSSADTALRECCEELGITAEQIDYLGPINHMVSQTGVRLKSHVGRLLTDQFQLSENEVESVFTVPVRALLAMTPKRAVMQVATRPKENFPFELLPKYVDDWTMRKTYPVYFFEYEGHTIWGLTARVLKDFLDIYKEIG